MTDKPTPIETLSLERSRNYLCKCNAPIVIGVSTAGDPVVLHPFPMCEDYEKRSFEDYLTAIGWPKPITHA